MVDWPERKFQLGELLASRAVLSEADEIAKVKPANWANVDGLADLLRGRVLFLNARPILSKEANQTILRACDELVRAILDLEAGGPAMAASPVLADKTMRGWGIEKPYNLRGIIGVNTVDLWTTSECLAALTAYLPWAKKENPALFREIQRVCGGVLDQWATRFSAPDGLGGQFFLKIGMDDPRLKRYLIYNTESLMAVALWQFSKALGPAVQKWKDLAILHGRNVKQGVCIPVCGGAQVIASNMRYMSDLESGRPVLDRVEDVAHGGLTLEVVDTFCKEMVLDGSTRMFTENERLAFRTIFRDHVVPRQSNGEPATKIWFLPPPKGAKVIVESWLTQAPADVNYISGTGWHFDVYREKPRIEIGHGLRTGRGWILMAEGDPDTLDLIYKFYSAYLEVPAIRPGPLGAEAVTRQGKSLFIALSTLYAVIP